MSYLPIKLHFQPLKVQGKCKGHFFYSGPIARRSPFYQSAAGEGRTPNLLIRSQMLYPIELRLRD